MAGNFIKDILSSFFGGNDPEAAKKKTLKNIAKNLSKTKYKFYKASSNEVEPAFAKFFYEIYKTISPAQAMVQSFNPNAFKRLVIDHSLSENQKKALEKLNEQYIADAARKVPLNKLTEEINGISEAFSKEFDSTKIIATDQLYTKLMQFVNFVNFDYYFTLKKFDNSLKEHNVAQEPRFVPINGSYIVEDLKNFVDVAWAMQLDTDWSEVFKLFKTVKGADPVAMGQWKKVIARLKYIKDNHIIEMLIQLLSENPLYHDDVAMKDLQIVDDFISDTKKTVAKAIDEIAAKQTAGKIDGQLTQIFGSADIEHLKYYNEAGSAPFERKSIGSFEYAEPLSYLKKFLIEYVKKDIKELSDILLVRGEWANQQMATPMSDAFHKLIDLGAEIIKLDDSCNESVDLGLKMKTHLPRADRDKESKGIIISTLNMINGQAARIILDATKILVTYDRNLKMILEDCVKQHPTLIINWKDIDHFAEGQLKQMSIDAYKQIFTFVSLMQNFKIVPPEDDE